MRPLVRLTTKEAGAYYTPDTLATTLAAWVVQTGQESLLEPSIGDGALLRAALAFANQRFSTSSSLRLIGCDVDAEAIKRVNSWRRFPRHRAREHRARPRDNVEPSVYAQPRFIKTDTGLLAKAVFHMGRRGSMGPVSPTLDEVS